jgi:hypothetical protein
MSNTHWKKLTNPDYIGAYALTPGQDLIATIKHVKNEVVTGADGKKEECIVVRFVEPNIKPMILNSTNAKTITKIYETPYIEEWQGKKIQLFADKVKAFGEVVEALRIRPFVPKETAPIKVEKCAECGNEVKGFGNLNAAQVGQYTLKKYGRVLCSECAENNAKEGKMIADE